MELKSIETGGDGANEMKKSASSRFQVAIVDTIENQITQENQNVQENGLSKEEVPNYQRRKSLDFLKKKPVAVELSNIEFAGKSISSDGPLTNGPESPTATFSFSGDSLRSRSSVDGYNKTNCVMNTVEALPCVDHYRNIFSATGGGNLRARPTLAELHEEMDDEELRAKNKKEPGNANEGSSQASPCHTDNPQSTNTVRFGYIQGVLIRCILNIFGVMLFIRLSWVVGNAGVIQASIIILLSTVVTTITAISMTAICTNGEVKGGGAYYMISRSLGPECGGAIGLIFSVANTVAVAMYIVGFAETVRDILVRYDCLMIDETNDIRIIGTITVTLLLAIALVGMDWEARAQVILLGILTLAIINYFIGLFLSPTNKQRSQGFFGIQGKIIEENVHSGYESGESFFSVFSVFFPAATGILAGANISGDLKNASKSIPKGTFLAILITTFVYLFMAIFLGCSVQREANGIMLAASKNVSDLAGAAAVAVTVKTTTLAVLLDDGGSSGEIVDGESIYSVDDYDYTMEFTSNCSLVEGGCKYGLLHSYQAVEMVAAWGPLVLAGIFSATLSSALASLMSAPKVFQALCKDKIFPFLVYFGVGYGPGDSPRRAFILCFVIALAFQMIADLNLIAPLISNFFLMSYALINFSCFDASIARSPGWRPSFRFYNKWLSFFGSILCIVVMFTISWVTALITFGCVGSLFLYIHHRKPDVNWGSSTQAHVYRSVLQSALKLVRTGEHIKNFRPQILVLSGEPDTRPALVDFCSHITKKTGLMVCGNIIIGVQSEHLRKLQSEAPYNYFRKRHIKAFYSATTASTLQVGAQGLMQNVGVGKFKPNLLILGFKSNWQTDREESVQQFLGIIHDAFDLKFGVGILRVKEGFGLDIETNTTLFGNDDGNMDDDFSDEESPRETCKVVGDEDVKEDVEEGLIRGNASKAMKVKQDQSGRSKSDKVMPGAANDHEEGQGDTSIEPQANNPLLLKKLNTQVLKTMNKFRNKEQGTIDVWWLFDDGGLTLLIPYILTTKAIWRGCRLRVFAAGTKSGDLGYEQRQLATLLAKFRIDCKDMTVLPEINKKPNEESVKMFNSYLSKWRLEKGETKEKFPWKTTDDELELVKEKTQRHIRLRELLLERSSSASLIVMTLPMPRKGVCSAGLYMCWIDTLTRDLPPMLLVRGNQQSVLTFYS